MKATIWLTKADILATLTERWAPLTDRYLQDGPQAAPHPVRISDINLWVSNSSTEGGFVEFTDEPEKVPEPVAPKESDIMKASDEDILF